MKICRVFIWLFHIKLKIFERAFQWCIICSIPTSNEEVTAFRKSLCKGSRPARQHAAPNQVKKMGRAHIRGLVAPRPRGPKYTTKRPKCTPNVPKRAKLEFLAYFQPLDEKSKVKIIQKYETNITKRGALNWEEGGRFLEILGEDTKELREKTSMELGSLRTTIFMSSWAHLCLIFFLSIFYLFCIKYYICGFLF